MFYRKDIAEVRNRLTVWWNGGSIGRPVLFVRVPAEKPGEIFPEISKPAGWETDYSTKDFDYRVYLAKTAHVWNIPLAESVPFVSPDLAPNCLALYLGCRGVEMPGTVWCEPFITEDDPAIPNLHFDADNFYWDFSCRLGREMKKACAGKCLFQFPDLIEGLDTLAAMRGGERLLVDLCDRPEWVRECLEKITALYFKYYDMLYDLLRDEKGGSIFWIWAPGRMSKFQCDFSAMIGPEMFREFMLPVLTRMTERVDYSMYHWDGPNAICHHDALLSIPNLKMIQWTPGVAIEHCENRRWWPLYHKTVEAGKKVFIGGISVEGLSNLKKEFGKKLEHFAIGINGVNNISQAENIINSSYI